MRAEILAVGTELLLGQIQDTNSTYIAEQLAASGVECYFQTRVGDNIDRIEAALLVALERSDAVIVCGGLGPTQDDLTREAIAKVMRVRLVEHEEARRLLTEVFARRNRPMSPNNLRQAEVPQGASIIPQRIGTAPGLCCPVGDKVVYALPGVPDEMKEMLARFVLVDLRARSGEPGVIMSRTIRTWGLGESLLSERLSERIDELDRLGRSATGDEPVPTLAFLASGIEGIKVRVTVRARGTSQAQRALDAEEQVVRAILGDIVFGIDDETMEFAIGRLLVARGLRLSVAESFTGGLVASRAVAVRGASEWFVGGIVSYASEVKHELLAVREGPVVSEAAAISMAEGVRKLLHSDVGLSTTGVAGPDPQEEIAPGNGFVGISIEGKAPEAIALQIGGGRNNVRAIATISALDALRHRLLG